MNQIVLRALTTRGPELTSDQLLGLLPNADAVPNSDVIEVVVSGNFVQLVIGSGHVLSHFKASELAAGLEWTLESAFGTRFARPCLQDPPSTQVSWVERTIDRRMEDAATSTRYEAKLAKCERRHGTDDAKTLGMRDLLADMHQAQGRNAEAITLREANIRGRQGQPYNPYDWKGVGRTERLAAAYQAEGRNAEAITLLEANLAECKRQVGADNFGQQGRELTFRWILQYRDLLVAAYQAEGRNAEAITLLEAERQRLLGRDNLNNLRDNLNNFAAAYQAAGQISDDISGLKGVDHQIIAFKRDYESDRGLTAVDSADVLGEAPDDDDLTSSSPPDARDWRDGSYAAPENEDDESTATFSERLAAFRKADTFR